MDDPLPAVPLLDLKAQYAAIKEEVDAALARVVASQHFINGPDVEALEQEVARYCGTAHCRSDGLAPWKDKCRCSRSSSRGRPRSGRTRRA